MRLFIRLLLVFQIFAVLSSCNRKADLVGLKVQPSEDQLDVVFNNATHIHSHSLFVDADSVKTKNLGTKPYLGSYVDPFFGKTSVGYYTQLSASYDIAIANDTLISGIDSAIIVMGYSGNMIGDSINPLNLHVYELAEDIDDDDSTYYYSNQVFDVNPVEIANYEFIVSEIDTIFVDETNYPQIRFPITNTDFLDRLYVAEPDDDAIFADAIKGLFLTFDESNEGALVDFDLANRSFIRLYYTRSGAVKYKTIPFKGENVSVFNHDYSIASDDIQQQIIQEDTLLGDQTIYLHGYAGIESEIFMTDFMETFEGRNVAINDASLILHVEMEDEEDLPSAIYLSAIDHNLSILEDFEAELEKGRYVFHFARYFQDLISGDLIHHGFKLRIGNTASPLKGLKLYGSENENVEKSMKIKIIYTELD
ncbi:MAG: DUF4270 family protein [Bacteroidales bacterium]|nr:DUF4270 family protein [Bacteroidales bacterium]